MWSLLHTNSTRFGPLQVRLRSNSKPSGFPALHPAPHLRGRGKTTFIGLISRGIGKLAGQCSGLDTFHQEAPSGARTTDSGKARLRRPVGRGPQPPAPPQPPEAWTSSRTERPPGPSAEASSLSCDAAAAAAKAPQKRRAAEGVRASPPRLARARASPESPGGGAEGGLGGGPERATKASALPPWSPGGRGHRFRGPREGWRERSARRAHSRSRALGRPQPPRSAQARAASLPRAGPAPARPLAARAPRLSPGLHLGSALPAPAPLPPHSPFPAPRRRRRRPRSPQLPIRALSAVDLVSPQKSPVCYSRCGGVVTGWSPGVRERGPRLQRSCNPNPPSGGIFHTPMAPLQTWVPTALCWPRCSLPR